MTLSPRGRQDWLYTLSAALHRQPLHSPTLMQTALKFMIEGSGSMYCCIVLFGDGKQIADAYARGDEDGTLTRYLWNKMLLQDFIAGVQASGNAIVCNSLQAQPEWMQFQHGDVLQPESAAAIPLASQGSMMGVIVLLNAQVNRFDAALTQRLHEAAQLTACSLMHAHEHEHALIKLNRHVEQERLRTDLTAMIYHDLRGPLQNIVGSLARLERLMGNDTGTLRPLVSIASRSAKQMTRMIKSLLDIERLETQEPTVNRQPLALRNLLCEAVDLVGVLAHESEQALEVEIDDSLPDIAADHDMIVRVVTNLLENAIKHTPMGGRIVLSATTTDDGVRVSVSDDGPGIPKHLQGEVFDKYVRLKAESKRDGYGLGLAFCRLAIEAHGGRIWVENGSNGGAVFAFRLPAIRTAMVA